MKRIIEIIIKIINYVYNPATSFKIHCWRDVIYSRWIAVNLLSADKVTLRYPITVIGGGKIYIGSDTKICKFSILSTWNSECEHSPKLIIGKKCNIGEFCHITAANKIVIGDGVLIGRWCTISDNSHGVTDNIKELQTPPQLRMVKSKGQVHIGDNVWLGDKVTVLAGVSIGEGSIIGANSVVVKDVPPYSVAVGNPTRIIKTLKYETI